MEIAGRRAHHPGSRPEGTPRRDAPRHDRGAAAPDGDRSETGSDRGGRPGPRRPHQGGRPPPPMTPAPALSIVVTSRNDNYGGSNTGPNPKTLIIYSERN